MKNENATSAEIRPVASRPEKTVRFASYVRGIALSTVLATLSLSATSASAQQGGAPSGGQSAPGAPANGQGTAGQGTSGPGAGTTGGLGAGTTSGQGASPSGQGGNGSQSGASVSGQGTAAGNSNSGGSLPGTNPAPDSPNFDLARTIQSALSSSAGLVQGQKTVEIDRKRADEVMSGDRPDLSANGSFTRFDAATNVAFALPGSAPIPFTVLHDHTEDLSISASENLDFLGIVRAQSSQVRLQALADTFTVKAIADQRIFQAQTLYFQLLRAIHEVQVSEAALRNAQEQQTVANKLYLGQIGQKIDLLRANTQVAQAQQNLTAAQNNQDISRANFNDLVGRPLNANVVVQDVPGVTVGIDIPTSLGGSTNPGGPAPVAPATPPANPPAGTPTQPDLVPIGNAQAAIGFAPFPTPIAEVSAINVDQSITTAVAQRPEILQAATLARAADVGVRVARSGLEPTFALSAAGNYYPTTSFEVPRKKTGSLTFTVSIPLYDGGKTRDMISEAKLQTENAQTSLASTQEAVTLQVRQAYLDLSTAARQIDAANSALQQAIAARQLAQVRYEGQVGLYLEVTDAQSALVQAENSQVDAVYNYLIARAQFETVLGTPQVGNAALTTTGAPASPATPAAPATHTPSPTVPTPPQTK